MEIRKENILRFRGQNSTLFTGRTQGEEARRELDLNKYDKGSTKIIFVIPKGTSSINPSFFLGLLYDSIKTLGMSQFEQIYSFEIEENEPTVKKVLLSNIEDGKRNALNELMGKTGLSRFLTKQK